MLIPKVLGKCRQKMTMTDVKKIYDKLILAKGLKTGGKCRSKDGQRLYLFSLHPEKN